MSVIISGALIDGAGNPMSGCHIILKSRVNTSEVVMRTVADVVTDADGEYSFEAQIGKYCVYLKQDWRDEYSVGDIAVYDDSKPGTLNDFLTALDEGDLKPDVVKRFEEMVAQAQQSAEAAAKSERQAGQHADDARKFAQQAEQAKEDIDDALAGTLKVKNYLSEIAEAGEEAQKEARDHLGIKNAGTGPGDVALQSDIYDRTPGVAAIPGSLGFGAFYSDVEIFSNHSGKYDLRKWVNKTSPGRYAVAQKITDSNYDPIIPGTEFRGEIEIKIPDVTTEAEHTKKEKLLIFYSVKGEAYFAIYKPDSFGGELTDWENARVQTAAGIYDRTPGIAAVPGSLGFGAFYSKVKEIPSAGGPTSFMNWLKGEKPGRYAVAQDVASSNYDPVIPGVEFRGEVEIKIVEPVAEEEHKNQKKLAVFYGVNGDVYFALFTPESIGGKLTGWENMKLQQQDVTAALCAVVSQESDAPAVGSLVLAAYTGASDDESNITIKRGQRCAGSRLRQVVFEAEFRGDTFESAPVALVGNASFPGTYVSLSGTSGAAVNSKAVITLFMRIA
ncbi:prophage tail fiber N-terminal domain-containing protein [Escherichia albertii]|nr:prophage tail fiber N-terminal domain-containing protein [Escherichia albertii]